MEFSGRAGVDRVGATDGQIELIFGAPFPEGEARSAAAGVMPPRLVTRDSLIC